MKKLKSVIFLLMFLPLAVSLFALLFLPGLIPAHFNALGQVDRWGSRFEALILPASAVLLGLLMMGLARLLGKSEENGANNQRVCLVAGAVLLLILDAMTGYFLYVFFRGMEDLSAAPVDVYQVIALALGLGLILLGNVMPKTRRNALLGLRTPWSMQSDGAWKRSQRWGGMVIMAAGLLMAAGSLFLRGGACLALMLGLLAAATVAAVACSYAAARREG